MLKGSLSPQTTEAANGHRAMASFDSIDINHDGVIDRGEFDRAAQSGISIPISSDAPHISELRAALEQCQAEKRELQIQLSAAQRGEKPNDALQSRVQELTVELSACRVELAASQKTMQSLKQQNANMELELEQMSASAEETLTTVTTAFQAKQLELEQMQQQAASQAAGAAALT